MFENLKENGIDVKRLFLIIFFIAILLIIILINLIPGGYLIVNESLILTRKNNKLVQVKNLNDDVLSKKYYVNSSDGQFDNVIINYSFNSWYYLDKDYTDLNLKKVKIAYTKEFKNVKLAQFDYSLYEEGDDVFLRDVLKKKYNEKFKNTLSKISYDLDNDGVLETIYSVTNESLSTDGGNYSTIFLVKDGKLIGTLDNDTKSPYIVQSVIDLDGNGKYEVIVSKGTSNFATFDTCYQIYSINGTKIKKIKDC